MQPHKNLPNLAALRKTTRSLVLPVFQDTVATCCLEELKAMITARGNGVTGRDGKAINKEDMQQTVFAYLLMKEKHPKYGFFQPLARWQWQFCQY